MPSIPRAVQLQSSGYVTVIGADVRGLAPVKKVGDVPWLIAESDPGAMIEHEQMNPWSVSSKPRSVDEHVLRET